MTPVTCDSPCSLPWSSPCRGRPSAAGRDSTRPCTATPRLRSRRRSCPGSPARAARSGGWRPSTGRRPTCRARPPRPSPRPTSAGMPGWTPRPSARWPASSERADQHPTVRLAAARALVVLDARDAAAALARRRGRRPRPARAGRAGPGPVGLPAGPGRLARAAGQPRRLARDDPGHPGPGRGQGGEGGPAGCASWPVGRAAPAAVRLEAARALGVLRPAGSEADARKLAADASPRGMTARLVAASLLGGTLGSEAVRQLQGFARDPEPAVAAVALGPARRDRPELVLPLLRSPCSPARTPTSAGSGSRRWSGRPTHEPRPPPGRPADRPAPGRPRPRPAGLRRAGRDGPRGRPAVIREADAGARRPRLAGAGAGGAPPRPPGLQAGGRAAGRTAPARPAGGVRGGRLGAPPARRPGHACRRCSPTSRLSTRRCSRPGRRPDARPRRPRPWTSSSPSWPSSSARPGTGRRTPFSAGWPRGRLRRANPAGPEARAAAIWALGLLHEGAAPRDLVGPLVGRLSAVGPPDVESRGSAGWRPYRSAA